MYTYIIHISYAVINTYIFLILSHIYTYLENIYNDLYRCKIYKDIIFCTVYAEHVIIIKLFVIFNTNLNTTSTYRNGT